MGLMILSRKRKRVILAVLVAASAVLLVGVVTGRFSERVRQRQKAMTIVRGELKPQPPVEHIVQAGELRERRRYAAEVVPERMARVPAEVGGVIAEVRVEAGQAVRAGEELARLDDRRARLAVEAARVRKAEAERLFREAERLQGSRVVSQSALEAARAEAQLQAALLADAEDLLARHVVRSPFEGYVNQRLVELGEAVAAYQAVAVVVDLKRLKVRFEVDEREVPFFPEGKTAEVWIPALGGEPQVVAISHVARAADSVSGLFQVEGWLDNPGSKIPGGLRGFVETEIPVARQTPLLPSATVRFVGDRGRVLRKSPEGAIEEVEVVLGAEVQGYFPVMSGIKEGDRVLFR